MSRPPSLDEAWLRYRQQPMHAFAFGVFTNGQPSHLPRLQPEDYTARSLVRLVTALDDLDTLGALT